MKGVTLSALRRLCFLEIDEAAEHFSMSPEELRDIEARDHEVPISAEAAIAALVMWRDRVVGEFESAIEDMRDERGDNGMVALTWYSTIDDYLTGDERTPSHYKTYLSAIAEFASLYHDNVVLVPFDRESYFRFLGDREDNYAERSEWTVRRAGGEL